MEDGREVLEAAMKMMTHDVEDCTEEAMTTVKWMGCVKVGEKKRAAKEE